MPRIAHNTITERITITTTRQVKAYLERLIPLGLYGNSVAEVAERLLCESLRADMKKRKVSLLEGENQL